MEVLFALPDPEPKPLPSSHAKLELLADSEADFSSIQGQDGWSYGFTDRVRKYDPKKHFELLKNFGGGPGAGQAQWYYSEGSWVGIWKGRCHPNESGHDLPNPERDDQFPVRRWESSYEGTVEISGMIGRKSPYNDATECFIFVDEEEVYSIDADPSSDFPYSVTTKVRIGSTVDFIVSPKANDLNDGTRFSAKITAVP